ncbi:MAG: alpha/beta hydrolase [Acidimicrobiales bacterium]
MSAPVLPGAEPYTADGGPHGALVLHGFTGTPHSVRGIGQALAEAGFAVELPRLPGHGTAIDDMLDTTFDDWSGEAESALGRLRARLPDHGRVVVVGLSMGGALTVWLATRHADLAGIACINPVVEPSGPLRELAVAAVADGTEVFPGIGSDIADPDSTELAYEGTPLRPLITLFDAIDSFQARLAKIDCPLLLLNAPNDHVVPPSNSDHLAASVSGPVERVTLERSYHVATLDYDKEIVVDRVVEFALRVTS